jgi:hypothetical protein
MSTGYETLSYDDLVAEQATVQAETDRGRTLDEYDSLVFPDQQYCPLRGSAVSDFARPLTDGEGPVTLDAILRGMSEAQPGRPIRWVDMGGGRGLAMRQLRSAPDVDSRLEMTNVDLFDHGFAGIKPTRLERLEALAPGITGSESKPKLIVDNVETVILSEPADLITSIEGIQYLDDPLRTLSNWYNQLIDNGVMFVATDDTWPDWIRYKGERNNDEYRDTPIKHLLEELSENGINYAVTNYSDDESGGRPPLDLRSFRKLAIQKKPGTLLKVTQPVTKVELDRSNYKYVHYEASADGSSPIVEVVGPKSYTATLGATTLQAMN